MSTTMRAKAHAASPGRGDWKETLGRVGLVGKGAIFVVVGILAIQLATGDAANANKNGAIEWVAEQPFGKFLLVLLTIGLFAMGVWRAIEVFTGDPVEGDEAKDKVKYGAQAVIYLGLGFASLTATIANWSGSEGAGASTSAGSGQGQQKATAHVLGWPAGQFIVALVGLAIIGYAIYQVKRHTIDEKFMERLDVGEQSWIATVGRFGYAARAVVYGIVGYFFIHAAITYKPEEASGLSQALQSLAGGGFGKFVLWVVAFGLVAFGAFTVAEAKHRRAA